MPYYSTLLRNALGLISRVGNLHLRVKIITYRAALIVYATVVIENGKILVAMQIILISATEPDAACEAVDAIIFIVTSVIENWK